MRRPGRLETSLLLVGILLIASYFRFVGLGWGEGQPIHPDEEFLRQVVSAVALPDRPGLYFDTEDSPLNPHNRGHGFFVYGTLPLFLTRGIAEGLDRGCEAPYSLPARLLAPLMLGRPVEDCWPGAFSGAGARMVGRVLAALFDLGSLVFVFLAGRRIYSDWAGLLGALLYALAVLPIQQAHFFTVDAFAGFFAAATLYLAICAAQGGGWGTFALAGLTTGLGMACKVSLWPLGLLVAVAGGVWLWERRGPAESRAIWPGLARLAVAGGVALLAFRVAQPYAFMGPGFLGLRLNPRWLANMAEIRGQMSGTADVYHGQQWTRRAALIFPWVNMVLWGLGLPLGLVAWAGWGVAGVELFRRWRRERQLSAALLPWIWGTGYFVYQGSQWVKSIRYLLPVYPAFLLWAAWLVTRSIAAWRGGSPPVQEGRAGDAGRGELHRPRRAVVRSRLWGVALGLLAVGGALCWALAFSSVYTRSHTRIAASRWILKNVPTAATVQLRTAEGERQVQVVIPAGTVYSDAAPMLIPLQVPEEADLTGVTLNHVADPAGDPEPERFRVAVVADPAAQTVLAEATREIDPPPGSADQAFAFPLASVRLLPETTYYLVTEVLSGGPLQLYTSVLALEHWDWPPPLRVDGTDPFGGMYSGLSTSSTGELQLYHDDTPEKRAQLLGWLDEADFIITGSNRLYASIPRLPTRYPLTLAYYEALFSGELGFELVADFTSFPSLGPFEFPDQEEPFRVPPARYQYRAGRIAVPMPPAEEAFSVYDHPRVLIFRKTPAYSRARAEALLPPSLLDNVVWVTSRQATRGVREPTLDPETWERQQAGGTWSEMFDRDSALNRSPWLAALVWYLTVTVLGWLAFPFLFLALPRLRDRGYGLARALGLLIVGYCTWLAASLRVLPNTRGTVALAALLLAAGGAVVAWRRWRALQDFFHDRRATVLIYEGLFLILFAVWTWVRVRNPDLWHPVVGGEKPMDFAYLNAVIKSTWFPPYNPWFSGGYINYYYFGFVPLGSLAKLLGIMPSVAYNLGLVLFYALTGGAAFCVAFNLTGVGVRSSRRYVAGILAVLFVLVLGNLGEVRLLVNGFRTLAGDPPFQSTIPGFAELVQVLQGMGIVLRGAPLPFRPETPYWDPTRMIPADPLGVGPITEFPAFTFLYGDLHAHMLALPYTLFALALALNWARGAGRRTVPSLLVGGLVIGSLLATNTWDYPTYLLLGLAGLAMGYVSSRRALSKRASPFAQGDTGESGERKGLPLPWLARGAALVGLTVFLFLPYSRSYVAAYTSLQLWQGLRTPFDIYILLVGQFLFPLVTLLVLDARAVLRRAIRADWSDLGVPIAAGAGAFLLLCLVVSLLWLPIAVVALPIIAVAAALICRSDAPVERRAVWVLLVLALVIGLAVEVVVLEGDIGRMNTVFKFYLQVWTSLAIGAAVTLVWLSERLARWSIDARQAWWVVMAMLVAAMALFPIMGIPARLNDRLSDATGPTLDGMAYMQYSRVWDVMGEVDLGPDYQAIVWLQDNVVGSPVILEGLGAYEYLWGNRVSIYTGLPTVVGWRWHQVQQQMAATGGRVERRHMDVSECYQTTDEARAREILGRYTVRYVYVGPYEKLYYSPDGLAKFDAMAAGGMLRVVYDRDGVKIYEVIREMSLDG